MLGLNYRLGTLARFRTAGSGGTETGFVFEIETDTPGEQFTIPCTDVGVFDALIEWGDGMSTTITAYNDPGLSHMFAMPGLHSIRVSGRLPSLRFDAISSSRSKLRSVRNLGSLGWLDLSSAFRGCSHMTSFVAGQCDTSAVTTINSMFRGADSMTRCDLTTMNIESVTNAWNFMLSAPIPVADYDAMLIAWAAQNPVSGVAMRNGNNTFTAGGAAEAARSKLITVDDWNINDGGPV